MANYKVLPQLLVAIAGDLIKFKVIQLGFKINLIIQPMEDRLFMEYYLDGVLQLDLKYATTVDTTFMFQIQNLRGQLP